MEQPYSSCISDVSSTGSYLVKAILNANYSYTQEYCHGLADQTIIAEACGCFIPFDALTGSVFAIYPACTSSSQLNCSGSTSTGKIEARKKLCPLECSSVHFSFQTSVSAYPTNNYFNKKMLNIYNASLTATLGIYEYNASDYYYYYVTDSTLKINVFFERLYSTTVQESAKTSITDLIGSLGGLLGLFLGASFMSLLETAEILTKLLISFFKSSIIFRSRRITCS